MADHKDKVFHKEGEKGVKSGHCQQIRKISDKMANLVPAVI